MWKLKKKFVDHCLFLIFFAGIYFRGWHHSKFFAGTYFRGWRKNPRKPWKLLPAKVNPIKVERTVFTSYCLWLTHDLSHVSFLIVCSYPIKFFLFSNYPMRHVMKFRNSAVLRLRILPLFRLDYLCENIHSCSAL